MNTITVKKEFAKEEKQMRDVYCATLMELAKSDERVFALDADLIASSGMKPFLKAFPDRMFNCGVQEADMIGIAAGLSATGKVPYAHTFGPFATRRVFDQIFISASYAKLNVRITGSDPGVTAAYNGGTHMPFEDMGILRSIPEITLLEPCDAVQLKDLVTQLKDLYGVFYIRMLRGNAIGIYEDGAKFEIGKGVTLCEGDDCTIFASGIMVREALKARDILAGEGISARVADLFTWKPLDEELVAKCSRETGAIVTAENHNVLSGLASAVSGVLAQKEYAPHEAVGVKDEFGEVGPEDYLRERFGLTPDEIVKAAKRAIARKNAEK